MTPPTLGDDVVEAFPPGSVVCDKRAPECVFTIGDGGYIDHLDGEWVEYDEAQHHAWTPEYFERLTVSRTPSPSVDGAALAESIARRIEVGCTHEGRTGRDWCCSRCHEAAALARAAEGER